MSEQSWTPTPEGSLCWIEIPGRDIEKLKGFYSALFPSWEFLPVYTNEKTGLKVHRYKFSKPDGLSGGIVQMPADCGESTQALGSGFTNYYLVQSVDKAIERVQELGGKLVLPKTAEGENGLFANVTDVEGNRFGVYEWSGKMS